jgi:hypothetical protein
MATLKQKYKSLPKWMRVTGVSLIVLALALHLILPPVIKYKINSELEAVEGYYGYVEDVDISIIRGAFSLQGLHIYSEELGKKYPVYESENIDVSIQWGAIFKGSLVAEIEVEKPTVYLAYIPMSALESDEDLAFLDTFTKEKSENEKSTSTDVELNYLDSYQDEDEDDSDSKSDDGVVSNFEEIQLTVFKDLLMDQIPIEVNRIAVKGGTLHYIDETVEPKIDVVLSRSNAEMTNITNIEEKGSDMIADFNGSSIMGNSGRISFKGSLDPYDEDVTMNLDAEMLNLELTELNDMFLGYGNFDVEKGTYSMYTEAKISSGKLDGYVKPFIQGLDVVNFQKDKQKVRNLVWQSLVGLGGKLVSNLPNKEIASKIPLKGDINAPDFGVLKTIGNLFCHAIFRVIKPKVDDKFNL